MSAPAGRDLPLRTPMTECEQCGGDMQRTWGGGKFCSETCSIIGADVYGAATRGAQREAEITEATPLIGELHGCYSRRCDRCRAVAVKIVDMCLREQAGLFG